MSLLQAHVGQKQVLHRVLSLPLLRTRVIIQIFKQLLLLLLQPPDDPSGCN